MCYALLCTCAGCFSCGNSARSRAVDQVDRNSNRLHLFPGRPSREIRSIYRIECRSSRFALSVIREELQLLLRRNSCCICVRLWRSDASGCHPQRAVLRSRLVLDCDWSINEEREHPGSSISSVCVTLFLPVSPLSECIFVESPIYCESRSCYALDALFIFLLFFFFPLKYLFSLAGVLAWDSACALSFFLLRFHSRKWYEARIKYRSSSRVCASSVQQHAEECSLYRCSDTKLRPMKERDGRSDKNALRESPWRHVDHVRTRVRTKKNGVIIFRGLYNSWSVFSFFLRIDSFDCFTTMIFLFSLSAEWRLNFAFFSLKLPIFFF